MKKRIIYVIALALLIMAVPFIFLSNNRRETTEAVFFPLKKRPGALATTEEARLVQKQFGEFMKVVRTNPEDLKSRIALSSLYIQEARITGDHLYYDKAAMKYINEVLEQDSLHFEALVLKALITMSRHQFSAALKLAEKARALNPDNAFVHGILVDGHVESGNYIAAIKEADSMMSLRPDLRSYSRVSYLREIHGDFSGAIEAMKLAVDAGLPGDEATEWARVHLGELFETTGDLRNARMQYEISLQCRPGYPYALAGMGRLAMASGEFDKAIAFLIHADRSLSEHSFKEELADLYELTGRKDKADSIIHGLINALVKETKNEGSDEVLTQNEDGEFVHVYLRVGDIDKALQHALNDFNRRPHNIQVNETLAWVYYIKKDYDKALSYLETAMKTKSKNPVLLCRAGLIYAKTENREKAKLLLGELKNVNCSVPLPLKKLGLQELKTL